MLGASWTSARTLLAVLASIGCLSLAVSAKATGTPFEALKGEWTGGGTVITKNGPPRQVTCKVNYQVTGNNLTQKMHCTGDDYEVDATLKLTEKAGRVKGSWSEIIYDASGGVTGRARAEGIRAVIRGDKFSGRMSLKVTDKGHTINILQLNEDTGTYRLATSLFLHR